MKSTLLIIAQSGFVLLTVIYLGYFIREIRKGINLTSWSNRRKKQISNVIIITFLVWGLFVSLWSYSGKMGDFSFFPFNFMPVIVIPLVITILLMFSKTLADILSHIPPANLIRLQSFRFFVEILLWLSFIADALPIQMTFEGRNFDVLTGITAPAVAWFAAQHKVSRPILILWNLACLALLINIVGVAILSTPSPWRIFMNEPANTIVADFPISWLPGFLVPLAYILHFLSLKQLLSRSREPAKVLKEV
jgi:hypothetical protein